MDQEYMTKMATAFLDELSEIEKQGFAPLRALGQGFRTLGRLGTQGAQKVTMRGLARGGRMAFGRGARAAEAAGKNRFLGGVKGFMGSPTGHALGAAGLTGLGMYGAYRGVAG